MTVQRGTMKSSNVIVPWKQGLHLRAATEVVRAAQSSKSKITLTFRNRIADARSVLAILMLCASMGAMIEIDAIGDDEDRAIHAVQAVFQSKTPQK
jgi:phosphocarrier protein HPr